MKTAKKLNMIVFLSAIFFSGVSFGALTNPQINPPAKTPEIAAKVIKIQTPSIELFGKNANLAEGFMVIENNGQFSHTLKAVYSPAAQETVLHRSFIENNHPVMQQIKDLVIPPQKEQKLQPGGLHVMLINLQKPLEKNTTVPIMLLFKDGSELTVQAKVV